MRKINNFNKCSNDTATVNLSLRVNKHKIYETQRIRYQNVNVRSQRSSSSIISRRHGEKWRAREFEDQSLEVFYILFSNQVTNEGLKSLLKSIGTNLIELQHLTLSLPSNQLRVDAKYEELFAFPFKNLSSLNMDFSFNEIQQDYLVKLFKQLSNLPLKSLNLYLESIKSNPIHFSRAIKELLQLQKL